MMEAINAMQNRMAEMVMAAMVPGIQSFIYWVVGLQLPRRWQG